MYCSSREYIWSIFTNDRSLVYSKTSVRVHQACLTAQLSRLCRHLIQFVELLIPLQKFRRCDFQKPQSNPRGVYLHEYSNSNNMELVFP